MVFKLSRTAIRTAAAAALLLAPATALTVPAHAHPPQTSAGGALLAQGKASYYRHGARTANGERFDPNGLTAAHRSLPFGSRVRVVDDATGRAVVVRINDRGPFTGGRVIDLAQGAARQLGMLDRGVATVSVYALE